MIIRPLTDSQLRVQCWVGVTNFPEQILGVLSLLGNYAMLLKQVD